MFDCWVHEVAVGIPYQINEIYFDVDDVVPSAVMNNHGCIKSNQVARIHTSGIHYQEGYAFAVVDYKNIYLIKKYYDGQVAKTREWYVGEYKF